MARNDFSPFERSVLICDHCPSKSYCEFSTKEDFILHLRNVHCTKEGGSFVCKYGSNNICQKLPFEGVSDGDYRDHVMKFHLPEPQLSKPKKPGIVDDALSNRNVHLKSQNLAAVLNDPRKSRREVACFFTRYWSDYFVEKNDFPLPANFPNLNAKDFTDYLTRTSKRRKLKRATPKFSDSSPQQNKTALKDIVPEMFFSPKFNLEEPQCFEALFLTANVEMVPDVEQFSSPEIRRQERLKPTKQLEEKLSFYLDSIEIQIARHVSSQSGSFFRAMTSHEDLQKSLAESLSNVKDVRRNLQFLDEKFTSKCLRLLNLKRLRSNRDALLKKLELISTVKQTQSMVQSLLHSGDYLGALELINTTQDVLKDELCGILCFRHLDAQLTELKICINKMLLEEFVRLLRRELDVESLLNGEENGDDNGNSIDEASFTTLIFAMCQTREFKFIHLLNEQVYSNVKSLIRERIKRAVDPADEDCDLESVATTKTDSLAGSLADQMRKLEFDQWFSMFKNLIDDLSKFLTKIELIKLLLQKLIISASGKSIETEVDNRLTDEELTNLKENLNEFLCQSCTYTQERLVRVLIARCKEDFVEKLATEQFLSLNNLTNDFYDFCINIIYVVDKTDQIRRILPLKSFVHSLTIKFLHKFHEDRREKLGNILDLEHWKSARVPRLFQNLVDFYEKSGAFKDFTKSDDSDSSSKSFLVVNNEEYAVVGVALIVVQMIAQYCRLMDDLPAYFPDLLTTLVDLLKIFNSRTCQLILGAGALHLVGLKSIGVRNLALASRSLQLVLYFINRLNDYFIKYVSSSKTGVLRHWIQLADDYQKHIDELFEKLSMIMNDQMLICLQKWKCVQPVPSPCFKKYADQCQRFYDNVKDVLPPDQSRKILLRLHANFKAAFKSRLSELNVVPHTPSYSIACSEFSDYLSNLKKLNCCAAVEDTMQDVMTS